jgi:DNA-binding CsgD family transcriptional regulator/tetratricopeptide (TPR) repeat protein
MADLVGRDIVLRLLADASAAATAGQGGLVMVRADPGVGVTAVLDRHLADCRAAGLRTYRVPVLPPDGRSPLTDGAPDWVEPAVVVVDDLQLADDATLIALHDLADGIHARPLLVVAGRHRGIAPERFAGLDRLATVHDLEPLSADAAAELLGDTALVDGAGGNPLLLRHLAGDDPDAAIAAWAIGLAGPDGILLRYAAILAEPTPVATLATVTATAPDSVLAGVERLAARGLVVERDGLVRLRHPVVRTAVAAASAGLRRPAAAVLDGEGAAPREIAAVLTHAPPDAWSVTWLAGHAAELARESTQDTVELLRVTISWLPTGDPRLHPMRAALAEAQLWLGQRAARDTATAGLAALPDPATRVRLRMVLAGVAIGELDAEEAVAALEPERVDGKLPPRLAVLDAYARLLLGDLAGATAGMGQASVARDDPLVAAALMNLRAVGACLTRDLDGALDRLDEATALLDIAVTDRGQRLTSQLLRAVVQDMRQDPSTMDVIEQARPLAKQLGHGFLVWLHTIAALADVNRGRWDDALAEIRAAMAMPDQYGLAGVLHALAANVFAHRGDLDEARAHSELSAREDDRGVAVFYAQLSLISRATLADQEGDTAGALEIVRAIADGGVGPHHGHAVATVGTALVRIACRGGDQDLARRLVDQLRQWASGVSVGEAIALMYCQGLADGDVELLLGAAERFAEGGAPVAAGRAAEDAAVVLAASGRSADAKAAYQVAVDHYTTLAADGDLHRADAALRAHGVRRGATGPRRRPKQGWDSLTTAEYRVAELVAKGATNREVAERLSVSVRTVDSHVSRVLAKLGYSSRVEIAFGFRQRT